MTKQKFKIIGLYVLSFLCSVLPVTIYFAINHAKYISTVPAKIKLGIGAVVLIVIVALKLAGKLKINSRIVVFGIVFALSYLLDSILNDLIIFSGLALLGEALDMIVGIFIKREKRQIAVNETAQANADAMEKVITKVSGR